MISPLGTPRSEAAGQMYQTVARLGMELKNATSCQSASGVPCRAQCSDGKDSSILCAPPHVQTQSGTAREFVLLSEIRQYRAEEYFHLHEQLYVH
eukprot:4520730-Amphidinium_carterae.1